MVDVTHNENLAENLGGQQPSAHSYSNLYLEGSPVRKYENTYFQMKEKIKSINLKYITQSSPTANSARKKNGEVNGHSTMGGGFFRLNADLPPAPLVASIVTTDT